MGRKKKQGKSRNKVRSAAAAAVSSDATANEPAYTIGKGASSASSQAGAGGRGNAVHPFASRPNRSVGGTLVSASGKGSPGPHHHHASCGLAHNTSTPLHMAVRGDHVDVSDTMVRRREASDNDHAFGRLQSCWSIGVRMYLPWMKCFESPSTWPLRGT